MKLMKTYLTPRRVDDTCPECGTLFDNLSVESDEDGSYVEISTEPCHDDECAIRLCACCLQFACECCGRTFCLDAAHVGREEEPECTCECRGDQADNRGCELHGGGRPVIRYWCRVCATPEEAAMEPEPVIECGQITEAA
ncbi:hypothetical protein SBA4_1750016 [Candidatus Sulfopaludibacter sp. SbA4]|nr:hypothetical protein SBA4_1750016 [Candidatus Sulfopaludibacter sp. SbA4]